LTSIAVVLLPVAARAQSANVATPATTSVSTPSEAPRPSQSTDLVETRVLSDPLYLPMKGQVFGATGYTFARPTGQNFKAGAETGAFTADDNAFAQTLAYGLTDRLTARIGFGYGVNARDSTADATGDVTVGDARGFSDPTFSVTYRLVDELRSPFILDVTGGYSPDLLTAIASGGVGEGTIARGGQNADLAFAVGHVARAFTLAGTVTSTYVGEQTTAQLSNGTSTSADGHWSYAVGVATQTRFTARASLDAGLTVGSAATYTVLNVTNGNSHTYTPPVTRSLNLALNYHFRPNQLVGAFTYAYDNNTDATNTFAKSSSDTKVRDRTGNTLGFRLLYAFK
jgi:hypothetical protein